MQPTIFKIICFVVSFCTLEIISIFIFKWIRNTFSKKEHNTIQKADWSVLKGLIERGMLLLGFVAAIPTIVVFFGAIKLGTRLKESSDSRISNDYFLIGNITSAIIVLLEYLLFQLLSK
jgi:hypothetical protein